MLVLVTGATGLLGSRVVAELLARGHTPRALTRREDPPLPPGVPALRGDLETGAGLVEALSGAEAVIHCASHPRRHRQVDLAGTARLLELASSVRHLAYPGIVGSDVIPLPLYRSKQRVEDMLRKGAVGWSVVRATHYHHLVWRFLTRLTRLPLVPVPRDTRLQPLDPSTHARLLVEAVEAGPQGRLPDIGGRHAYEARDLARSYLTAVGLHRRVVRLTAPGIVGAAFRAGGNLTPNRDEEGLGWNAFVRSRMEKAQSRRPE